MFVIIAFFQGLHHGLGTDHLVALTTLANRGATRREISRAGLRFALGHSSALVFLVGAALLFSFAVPRSWETHAEVFGGVLLILLGAWTLLEVLLKRAYVHSHMHDHWLWRRRHEHQHLHFKNPHPGRHLHPHFTTVFGGLFALSGLRSLFLTSMPILNAHSVLGALLAVAFFGLGITASMSAYGWLAGSTLGKCRKGSVSVILGSLSLMLGVYWIYISR
ncbi:MAG: hypothetical protein HY645_01650 [Acidobacteria bacterium]|nr:hypothetical protein [Acidobacteriota bacterium]